MTDNDQQKVTAALERVGLVLGALYAQQLENLDLGKKAKQLSSCGFSNVEIARLLGTTANAINVALHRHHKGKSKKASKGD